MRDLDLLDRQLREVGERGGGRAVVMTGHRRVGKSRLAQEFCDRSGVPYVVFQATRGRKAASERADFVAAVHTGHPAADTDGVGDGDWNHALRTLADAVPDDRPSIAVIDEIPWLTEQDPEFEGALQTIWDRRLSDKPVLLILIGSDLSVMTALQSHERPFFGRAGTMVVTPLNMADVADMTGLSAADAIDALLITGGFPEIVGSWRPGMSRVDFLRDSLGNPLSPLLMAGALTILGEFPQPSHTRAVLEAIGSGERTFGTIANAVGGRAPLPSGTLSPLLTTLLTKRVIADDLPLSTASDTKNRRYRVADPYLRFWLGHLQRVTPLIERGRDDLAFRAIEKSWTSWRGRAVEPVIRDSLLRIVPNEEWPDTEAVGSWWNRRNNPEVDIIGADRSPIARDIQFVGSIKWLDDQLFDRHDYDSLTRVLMAVPGTDPTTGLIAVSSTGATPGLPLRTVYTPEDLLAAWR